MRSALFGWVIVAAVSASGVARAQSAPSFPSSSDEEIIVKGRKGQEQKERVFVDALTVPSAKKQLARLEDDVCPVSIGLTAQDNDRLVRRMRRLADAVGMRAGQPGCRSNVVVLVVPDRKQAIAKWKKDRPDFFAGLSPREIAALAEGDGPVAAWQIVQMKGKQRRPIGKSESDLYDYKVQNGVAPSRIGSQIQLEFFGSFVLVEASALKDVTLVQLADYAAMRTFAKTDEKAANGQPLPTILSLFAPAADPPLSVTDWDVSFLKALYATRPDSSAKEQQRAMTRVVKKEAEAKAQKEAAGAE